MGSNEIIQIPQLTYNSHRLGLTLSLCFGWTFLVNFIVSMWSLVAFDFQQKRANEREGPKTTQTRNSIKIILLSKNALHNFRRVQQPQESVVGGFRLSRRDYEEGIKWGKFSWSFSFPRSFNFSSSHCFDRENETSRRLYGRIWHETRPSRWWRLPRVNIRLSKIEFSNIKTRINSRSFPCVLFHFFLCVSDGQFSLKIWMPNSPETRKLFFPPRQPVNVILVISDEKLRKSSKLCDSAHPHELIDRIFRVKF